METINEQNIKAGYCLLTSTGDFHFILKVKGNAYVDEIIGKWSIQSKGNKKETILYVWDGYFMNKRSLSEVQKAYASVFAPDDRNIIEVFEKINNQ